MSANSESLNVFKIVIEGAETGAAIDKLAESIASLRKEKDALKNTDEQSAKQIALLEAEIKRSEDAMKKSKAAVEAETGSINALREANKKLTAERNATTTATEEGRKKIESLNNQINANNALIKANVDQLTRQKIEVGNYRRGITDALKEIRVGGVNVGEIVDKVGKAHDDLFKGLVAGYKESGIQAKLFGTTARTALTLTGIGVVIALLATLIAKWDDIKVAIGLADEAQVHYFKVQQENLKRSQDMLEQYSREIEAQNRLLELQGNKEREIYENRRKELLATLSNQQAQKQNLEEQLNLLAKVKAFEEGKLELTAFTTQEMERASQVIEDNGGSVKTAMETLKTSFDKVAQDMVNTNNELSIASATYSKEQTDREKKAYDERKKASDKAVDDYIANVKKQNEREKQLWDEGEATYQELKELEGTTDENYWDKRAEVASEGHRKEMQQEQEQGEAIKIVRTEKSDEEIRDEEIKQAKIRAAREATFNTALSILSQSSQAQQLQTEAEVSKVKAAEQAKLKALEERFKKGLISEEAYNKQKDRINAEASDKERELKKKGFESEKKNRIAATIISTLQSAVNSFESLSKVPYVGPVLGAAAAAAALVFGYKNVASIRATEFTGFADGGDVKPGLSGTRINQTHGIPIRRSNGDNLLATVRTGEVILNEKHQAALGGASTFAAIGVPGFDGSGLVGSRMQLSNMALANGNGLAGLERRLDRIAEETAKMKIVLYREEFQRTERAAMDVEMKSTVL